ncbi:TWiK family of potassium channels protein [Dirofilaria immitis]
MVPTGWLRFAGSKMGPIFLRVLLITVVSIYAVFGALVLSHLETQQVDYLSNVILYNEINQISFHSSLFAPVYANRWNHSQNNIRHCITNVIKDLIGKNNCSNHAFDHLSLHHFKYCYHYNLLSNVTDNGQRDDSSNYLQSSNFQDVAAKKNSSVEAWPFIDSLLFAFALITTIGYGNITPKTFAGQMFCIFFAAFGIPLTLLTIADLGKFISQIIFACSDRFIAQMKMIICNHKSSKYINNNSRNKSLRRENSIIGSIRRNKNDREIDGSIASSEISDNDEQSNRTLTLFILFVIYVIAGSLLISTYEPEMPFFTAVYFNFITLTSIGLGDIVPQRRTYMAVTILYIIIGLALATIAIEIAADTLKKLHYFRRTIKHFGNIEIWFGGKRLTVRQIIRNFCDQFNVPDAALSGFTISNFVERAIKVEAGKLPPLRNQSFRRGTNFDEENEHLNEASALTESEAELEPAPEVTSQPKPTPEYESHPESCLSEFSSEREIPNVPEIPVLTLSEATLLREPSPIIEKLEPILKPELYRSELLEEVKKIPYECEIPVFIALEPTSPLKSVPNAFKISQPENSIREEPPENTETLNRRGYSEEAWKRYQEYQNEWSKFYRLSRTLSRKNRRRSAKKQSKIKRPDIQVLPDEDPLKLAKKSTAAKSKKNKSFNNK